ncbi:MAG: bifunctional phosphoglucose/phosphomannose isomerase [Patescibacteria group bacterium]|nr:bifunctional phosphoglucose/phosphomannose isomerase [Patescibacteria group bacterium]
MRWLNLRTMPILDHLEKIKAIDGQNLAYLMEKFPFQLKKVWQEKEKINPPADFKEIKNVVFVGMGCDRVAAELMKKFLSFESSLPVEVVSGYQVPKYINQNTLVVFLSYSGNTLEVLSTLKSVQKKKAKIFIISGGGKLNQMAEIYHFPRFQFKGSGPSRANLGYLFFSLFILCSKLKLIKFSEKNFLSLINFLEEFSQLLEPKQKTEDNVAKYLAYQIFDRLPFIIGAEHLSPVAQRWKKEINENAKTFSFAETMPEFFHNTIIGLEFPFQTRDEIFFLFLESAFYDEQIKKALDIFKKFLRQEKICFETIPAVGKNRLTEMMAMVLLGDWLSFYLAILNQVDPTPVELINYLKNQLSQ